MRPLGWIGHCPSYEQYCLSSVDGTVQVLSFDNRGIGRSREASPQMPKADHTYVAEVLAADVWSLVDHVWGPEQQVHLYGQSMGGMIIQKAALLDLERVESSKAPCRVQSLFLSVTSR